LVRKKPTLWICDICRDLPNISMRTRCHTAIFRLAKEYEGVRVIYNELKGMNVLQFWNGKKKEKFIEAALQIKYSLVAELEGNQ